MWIDILATLAKANFCENENWFITHFWRKEEKQKYSNFSRNQNAWVVLYYEKVTPKTAQFVNLLQIG